MRPVDQVVFGHGGDCFAACVATLLSYPLIEVPNFCGLYGDQDWWTEFCAWAVVEGWAPIFLWERHVPDKLRDAPCIATGPAARGHRHSVVYSGNAMVHDPHPDKTGISEVVDRVFLIHLEVPA